ncbi:MAG: hypothetical protein OEX02_07660 [Cyclobacteriaceae bacterium]|nr:hypothetical protein [Cyclobacteriaceae bacterium]
MAWFLRGGLYQFNIKSKKSIVHKHNPNDDKSLVNNAINQLYKDNHGTLWNTTDNGISLLKSMEYIKRSKMAKKERQLFKGLDY